MLWFHTLEALRKLSRRGEFEPLIEDLAAIAVYQVLVGLLT